MSEARFYMIQIARRKDKTLDDVVKVMNLARDWYRIGERFWVVYTTVDAARWYERLSPLVSEEGRVFVCRLDTADRQGWMEEGFWKWIRREDRTN